MGVCVPVPVPLAVAVAVAVQRMVNDFELKAKRYAELLTAPQTGSPDADEEHGTVSGVWPGSARAAATKPAASFEMVALMVMKADATSKNASLLEGVVDRLVQFGQPYPAVTHVELWIGDKPAETPEHNHFSTYLGAEEGAQWTSGTSDYRAFYASPSWSAVPIFADDIEQRVRRACNQHCSTPYPAASLLWQYPMSIWPLRAFSGFLDDRINAPAHCAALTTRVLRSALPDIALPHSSHWYGPSSLYLELSTPERMENALAVKRSVVRSIVEEESDEKLVPILLYDDDDAVKAMSSRDAQQALGALATRVMEAGSRKGGAAVDQDLFRTAQEAYARGLTRYTWLNRKGDNL